MKEDSDIIFSVLTTGSSPSTTSGVEVNSESVTPLVDDSVPQRGLEHKVSVLNRFNSILRSSSTISFDNDKLQDLLDIENHDKDIGSVIRQKTIAKRPSKTSDNGIDVNSCSVSFDLGDDEELNESPAIIGKLEAAPSVRFYQSFDDTLKYMIADLPIVQNIPNNLKLSMFNDVQFIASGTNAEVFSGYWDGERVAIKMMKESQINNPKVHREFLSEFELLKRLNHPNIIRIRGSGAEPRRFLVLDWMVGGILSTICKRNVVGKGILTKLVHTYSFPFKIMLKKMLGLAQAFEQLHNMGRSYAILHRDLKLDNIGLDDNGNFILLDFGLSTVVKIRSRKDDKYKMSGGTGSLRYMAPEVASNLPYNQKADVYSFSIVMWQVASDRIPYKKISAKDFVEVVVNKHFRPKLYYFWPVEFKNLLFRCWGEDIVERPDFTEIVAELVSMLTKLEK
eukprot:gene4043-5785_t